VTQISFHGATGTVTGSKKRFDGGKAATMVDCGHFQGFKELRLRNWQPLPVDPKHAATVVRTRAHIDHSRYLPLLVRNGFTGKIHCGCSTSSSSIMLALYWVGRRGLARQVGNAGAQIAVAADAK